MRLRRAGRQKTELSRSGQSIVACDVAELAEERRALVDGGTSELAECVLSSRARHELATADGQDPTGRLAGNRALAGRVELVGTEVAAPQLVTCVV